MPRIVCSFDNALGGKPKIANYQAAQMLDLMKAIYGWTSESATGSYMGQEEQSVVVDVKSSSEESIAVFLDALEAAGQKSVIRIDARGFAELVYLDASDHDERLGRWVEITEDDRVNFLGWTRLGDKFFSCTASRINP